MNAHFITLDRWLVHPPELCHSLMGMWLDISASELMAARLESQAVSALASLDDLPKRLAEGAPGQVCRIVVQRADQASTSAIADAVRACGIAAADVHVYAFEDQPMEVLATLCTPERAVQQATDSGARFALQDGPLGPEQQRRFEQAVEQWRSAHKHVEDETDATPCKSFGDQPFAFDWCLPTKLRADVERNMATSPEFEQVWSGVDSAKKLPAEDPAGRRWTAQVSGLPGAALAVELDASAIAEHRLDLKVTVSAALPMGPRALMLELGNREPLGPFAPIAWVPHASQRGYMVGTAKLAISERQAASLERQRMSAITLSESIAGDESVR